MGGNLMLYQWYTYTPLVFVSMRISFSTPDVRHHFVAVVYPRGDNSRKASPSCGNLNKEPTINTVVMRTLMLREVLKNEVQSSGGICGRMAQAWDVIFLY